MLKVNTIEFNGEKAAINSYMDSRLFDRCETQRAEWAARFPNATVRTEEMSEADTVILVAAGRAAHGRDHGYCHVIGERSNGQPTPPSEPGAISRQISQPREKYVMRRSNPYHPLQWIVQCKPRNQAFFENIAAFNHDGVALDYAMTCAVRNMHMHKYQVVVRNPDGSFSVVPQ